MRTRAVIPTYRVERAVWRLSGRHQLTLPLPATREVIHRFLPDWTVERARDDYTGRCYYEEHRITVGWKAPRWIIWHEIAHGLPGGVGHNASFRRNYVDVVAEAYSERWARRLERAFLDAGLAVAPSRAFTESQAKPLVLT